MLPNPERAKLLLVTCFLIRACEYAVLFVGFTYSVVESKWRNKIQGTLYHRLNFT